MADKIIIERLEFEGRCGISPDERRRAQPMAIDLELDCETALAALSGRLGDTVDYALVAERLVALAGKEVDTLLQTMAQKTGSVGLRLDRPRAAHLTLGADSVPSRFVTQQLCRLPKGRALDVACGSGRHALYLAANGFEVDAIDRDRESLAMLSAAAAQRSYPQGRWRPEPAELMGTLAVARLPMRRDGPALAVVVHTDSARPQIAVG